MYRIFQNTMRAQDVFLCIITEQRTTSKHTFQQQRVNFECKRNYQQMENSNPMPDGAQHQMHRDRG
jgi:hypothetical protein